jgi:hypothetical protein
MTNRRSGGVEFFLDLIPSATTNLAITTNITARSSYSDTNDIQYPIIIYIKKVVSDGNQQIYIQTKLENIIEKKGYVLGADSTMVYKLRIFIYDYYLSIYCNSICVYSYIFADVNYHSPVTVSLSAVGGDTLVADNIVRKELKDEREAIWVDYEANTESTIQSVIQQRPIEITVSANREIEFTYSTVRDSNNAVFVKSIVKNTTDNLQLSSDGIVYSADVGVSIDEDTAEDVGLITRMYRLSELDSGAIEAAGAIQLKALQKRKPVSIVARLDPRLEQRDVYSASLITSAEQTVLSESIIVEDINIGLVNGNYKMTVTGRNNA